MSQVVEVTLDDEGRMVIPAELRERLDLSPGMLMVVEQGDEDTVRLRAQPGPLLVDKGGVLVISAEALEDINDITRQERENRALDLAQRSHQ
jgi:AbrB family looped-hinge helix DNA binding protein